MPQPEMELVLIDWARRAKRSAVRWAIGPPPVRVANVAPTAPPARLSDGRAQFLRCRVCDAQGNETAALFQGDEARFEAEFEIAEDLGPISGGIEIADEGGQVLHGKESFQRPLEADLQGRAGTIVRFRFTVKLDLAVGRYVVTFGLASADAAVLARYRAGEAPYAELGRAEREHVRAGAACEFRVLPRLDGSLPHHGLTDLPGSQSVEVLERALAAARAPAPAAAAATRPTVFHVTHWKSGSQWLYRILRECEPERIVAPRIGETQFRHWPIQAGQIYPTVYVTKKEFDAREQPGPFRRFVVIRDLRDTLVSGYFSMKVSHEKIDRNVARFRGDLASRSFEDGMIYLMDEWLGDSARIQLSWAESGERVIRYEDLLEHDLEILEPLLLEECGLDVPRERFRRIVDEFRFRNFTQGRPRGVEDVGSHERKGISGDWKNHFTEPVKRAFKARFGGLLVATGYERGLDW